MLNDQLAIHLYHINSSLVQSNDWQKISIERNKNKFDDLKNRGNDNIISWNNENKKMIYKNKFI